MLAGKYIKTVRKWLDKRHSYAIIALFFRVLLAFIYLTVFISLSSQILELIGSKGILPIAELIKNNPQLTYFKFPTLHLFFSSDAALIGFLLLGMIFSIALALGYFPRTSLLACIIIYLSYVTSGRTFFHFQWDNLLLEASFLALFLPLQGKLFQPKQLQQPSPFLIFLFRWLLFRLYFESGLAKIFYGQGTWLNLTAMNYYYATAPLPSFGGWFAQQPMPEPFHIISLFFVFFLELVLPLFLFYPRKLRMIAFYFLVIFNVIIGFTSNYGFFNPLTIFIGIFLLDDQHLKKLKQVKQYFKKTKIH